MSLKKTAKKKPARDKVAARLVVLNAADFSPAGARRIASWLEAKAKEIRSAKTRKRFASRFTARYFYR